MPEIEEMSSVKPFGNILVYGDSGVGKTVLAGTAGNGLIIAIDKGIISAARQGSTSKLVKIHEWEEFSAVTKYLRAGGYREYDWVVIDGLTMLQERLLRFVMDEQRRENSKIDEWVPSQAGHQKQQNMMRFYVNLYCDLPVNVLFTALPMNIETEDGEERVIPLIHGQKGALSNYCVGMSDAFGYMKLTTNKAGQEVRRITWRPNGAYIGKDRFGVLAPFTDDITLPEIAARIAAPVGSTRRTATTARRRRATTRRSA